MLRPALRAVRSQNEALRVARALPPCYIAQQQRRPLLHLPALGAVAALGVKKIALVTVLRKLGLKRVFEELRALNSKLHTARPDVHPTASRDQVEAALTKLDSSVQGLRESEQLQLAWKYFEGLEKENPRLYQVLVKSYLDTLSPVKWASALLKEPGASSNSTTKTDAPTPLEAADLSKASAEGSALLKKLHTAAPELSNYHVILVPKSEYTEKAGAEQANDAAAGAEDTGRRG